jgi:ribosomal protein S18 acetylase RimI-like enzyme
MNIPKIIRVTTEGLAELQKICRQTFYETFSKQNTEENMKRYLEEDFSAEKLTKELQEKNTEFYFAALHNNVIGYLKLNFGKSHEEEDNNALEIERIYVLKEFHGKNVGQLLFETAIQKAIQKNLTYVWLGVWEHNPRAIHFYKKNGFMEFGKHPFILGDDKQTDILMRLELN